MVAVTHPMTSPHVLTSGVLTQADPPLLEDALRPSQRLRLMMGMVRSCTAKGYATTTVADVVAHARVSRQTFYEQFDSKEECFLATQDLGHRLLLAQVVAAARGASWEEDLDLVLRAYFELLAAEPELARATLVEALAVGPAALTRRERAIRRHAELLELLHERGRSEGSGLAPLDRDLSLAIIGGINELALTHLRSGDVAALPRLHGAAFAFARAVMRDATG